MGADGAGLSVVVLSYQRPRQLARALESIAAQTLQPSEVIVVDNRSPASDEIAALVAAHPGFTLVPAPGNLGFTGGMNLGLQRASGGFVHLTEDDVVMDRTCLARLMAHAAQDPDAGLLSGIMVDEADGTILSAGGELELGGVYRQRILRRGETYAPFPGPPYDVGYVPGAMIFARRSVWASLGGFREDFFMYHDDTDLSLRARRAGIRITVVPDALVRHLPVPAGPPSSLVSYHKLKNFFALYLLHGTPPTIGEVWLRYGLLALVRGGEPAGRRLLAQALVWNVRHLMELLADRGKVRPSTAPVR